MRDTDSPESDCVSERSTLLKIPVVGSSGRDTSAGLGALDTACCDAMKSVSSSEWVNEPSCRTNLSDENAASLDGVFVTRGENPMVDSTGSSGFLLLRDKRTKKKRPANSISPPTTPPTVASTITSVLKLASSSGPATLPDGADTMGSDLAGGGVVEIATDDVTGALLFRVDMGPKVEKCVVWHSMRPVLRTFVLGIFSHAGGLRPSL